MDGHGNHVVPAECFWMTYLDGGVPVPIPVDSAGLTPRAGGFTFPAHDGHRAAIKDARQMDHYRRVRRNARRMPEVAARLGGEDLLVHLMYGDIDECCRLFEAPPTTTAPAAAGQHATYYVPNC